MLNYEQFKTRFVKEIVDYLPLEIRKQKLVVGTEVENRLNDNVIVSIQFNFNEKPECFSISAKFLYREYLKERAFNAVIGRAVVGIVNSVRSNHPELMHDCISEIFRSQSTINEKIVFRLVNRSMNEKLLSQSPHREFMDLAIVYEIFIENEASHISFVTITNEIANAIHLDEEQLYTLSMKNTPVLFPATVQPLMNDILFGICNTAGINGASVLNYEETISELAESVGSNLYIFPSDVNYLLAMKFEPFYTEEDIRQTVLRANSNIGSEQVLGENVYFYDRETHTLSIF